MSDVATIDSGTQIARPLKVLVPLIMGDLRQAKEAAKTAAEPYYRAAGEKMIEARSQMSQGEFNPWVVRTFGVGHKQARLYMSFARATGAPRSLHEHRVRMGARQTVYPQAWHEPIKKVIGEVDTETLNRRAAELARSEERETLRKLALQLIDIGYKALATKLHPDKGGSRDAMARLNALRHRLKQPYLSRRK